MSSHETWSGIVIPWPVDETSDRLPVELSGLPVFDRDRNFRGYRGFGVCRDVARINQLTRTRRDQPPGFRPLPDMTSGVEDSAPPQDAAPAEAAAPSEPAAPTEAARADDRPAANVLPFRPGPPAEAKAARICSLWMREKPLSSTRRSGTGEHPASTMRLEAWSNAR